MRRRFYNRKFCSGLAEENAKHVSQQYVSTRKWKEEIFSTKWLSINEVSGSKEVLNCTNKGSKKTIYNSLNAAVTYSNTPKFSG